MRILLLLTLLLVSAGCSTVTVKRPDCEATYTRVWFEQEGFTAEVCGGKASVQKTSLNLDTLNAVLPLLTKGALQ